MKQFLSLLLALVTFLVPTSLLAQEEVAEIGKPVAITYTSELLSGSQYKITVHATIEPGWKLFSTKMGDDDVNSRIHLDSATATRAKFVGTIEETGTMREETEPMLESLVKFYENNVHFSFVVDVADKTADIKGSLVYMALKGEDVVGPEPVEFRLGFDATGALVAKQAGLQVSTEAAASLKRSAIDMANPVNDCGGTGVVEGEEQSLFTIFILGFLGGLLALIMPCTFPMIPLTVSFFTKQSKDKGKGVFNAFMYGFFIFLIYVLLSVPFYFLDSGSSDILNNISTNAWLNIVFAIIFFVFALSFFGLFEIGLPAGMQNKVDSKSSVGSLGGIFFMALTLAIVSFSCTGPILGTLLVGALNQDGGAFQLTIAMCGFGIALGLPFGLFALFPNWLTSLPRSGAWMNTVKIVFAFIELALMIKFLSNADLVMHWGILKREVFFGLWILIGLGLTAYLFGILKFKHDPPPAKLGKLRIASGIFFLALTLYLVPGLTNTKYANLSLVSGFPPPMTYSLYGHEAASGKGVDHDVINDYEKALALSKETGKPLLIDFTGWACVNCRKMEEQVWTDDRVKSLIKDNFILVSLYVDDRQVLPDDEQFIYKMADGSEKVIKTVGNKFATMQSENFKNVSQPLYAIVNGDEKLMNRPVGYTPSISEYAEWLQCGLEAFKK